MTKYITLNKKDLTADFTGIQKFSTTKEISPYENIIGQNRAVQSIDLGLEIDRKEYNIFISGRSSTGKTSYIVKKIEDYAKNSPSPGDWCYVYNFEDSKKPTALYLNTNTAVDFKHDIDQFIDDLSKEVPIFFNDRGYEKDKNNIIRKYEKLSSQLSNQLSHEAEKNNFRIEKSEQSDFIFIPLEDGKDMEQETYDNLSDEEKNIIRDTLDELNLTAFEINTQVSNLQKQLMGDLSELNGKVAESILNDKIEDLKNKYGYNEKNLKYLDLLKKDIIENIEKFDDDNEILSDENELTKNDLVKKDFMKKQFLKRYKVNVIVNNTKDKNAPVIFEDSPEYSNLFGKIEYENVLGNIVTDFTMIHSGSIHAANGGYLIVNAEKLISNPNSWDTLKRCLKSKSILIEKPKNNIEIAPFISLSPEKIPLNIKVILMGSDFTYSVLSSKDPDFSKLFKIKAEFDNKIENNEKNISNIIGFISNYVDKNNTFNVTREGMSELLKYSCRLAGNKNFFTARMSKLLQILDIANIFAKKNNSKVIGKMHIKKSILEFQNMHGLYRKRILEMYKNGKRIVNLKGSKVGQINGLSVMDFGDSIVGQQHRITVTTFAGKKGIINIERETEMSGSIHDKGIMILSGYIGQLLGQNIPLSFNASIVFEQLYSGIEGDSASAAELLSLLSSLSDVPIKQSLAITGSVNQRGEIQPIGGVNEKIEGFFDICEIFGLDGSHGVIIPMSNVDDLVLDDKVIEAVEKGLFHIYAVDTIDQCMEILFLLDVQNEKTSNLTDEVKNLIFTKIEKYNHVLKNWDSNR